MWRSRRTPRRPPLENMIVRVKLYAKLDRYLPDGASGNQADLDVAEDATVTRVLTGLGLPPEVCHLVLINGVYVAPGDRAKQALQDGDHLAVWPPVAGGVPKPIVIEKEMAVTHADFFRTLPRALGTDKFKKSGARVLLENGDKRLNIALGPEGTRQIANLAVPATNVALTFTGYTDAEASAALKLFERMFQKGGG